MREHLLSQFASQVERVATILAMLMK